MSALSLDAIKKNYFIEDRHELAVLDGMMSVILALVRRTLASLQDVAMPWPQS